MVHTQPAGCFPLRWHLCHPYHHAALLRWHRGDLVGCVSTKMGIDIGEVSISGRLGLKAYGDPSDPGS